MKKVLLYACLVLALSSFSLAGLFEAKISEDYHVKFSTSKAVGSFRGLSGDIVFDPNNLESSRFDMRVDVGTINTGNKKKDKHAIGKSWFKTSAFPNIRFVSSDIELVDEEYLVSGTLTIRDVSKEISFPFTVEEMDGKRVFSGKFTIDRYDYKIDGPALMGRLVGDMVDIELKVPVDLASSPN
ncbi:MAG: YceI family protein [Bacteroidota bacterium]